MHEAIKKYQALCALMLMDNDISSDYKWIAMDSNGMVFVYIDIPISDKDEENGLWYCQSDKSLGNRFGIQQLIHIGHITDEVIQLKWEETCISVKELLND